LFERSTRASKATTRKKDLQSFFGAYSDDDFFPLMRLLLPQVTQGPSCHSSTPRRVPSGLFTHPRVRCGACVRACGVELQLDKERQTYGMKESVLAKLYVQILGISPESDDGKRLIHWRRPNGGTPSSGPW
jgi:hypothetical protein